MPAMNVVLPFLRATSRTSLNLRKPVSAILKPYEASKKRFFP